MKGQLEQEYAWFKLGSSLPGLSMNAERAGRQILEACVRGEAEVVLSAPAKAMAMLYGVAPSLMQDVFGLVSSALPSARGGHSQSVEGKDVDPHVPKILTRLADEASLRNNEL